MFFGGSNYIWGLKILCKVLRPFLYLTEQSHEATLKRGTHDYVAVSKKTESPVCKEAANNRLEDVDVLCVTPAVSLDSEDDHGSVKSPLLLEEPKPSPAHV